MDILLIILVTLSLLILIALFMSSWVYNKFDKDHPFRKWWEKHICADGDDYPYQ